MKITAAVLYEQGLPRPYARSRPLRIETVELDGPGEGEVLVRVAAAGLCHSDLSTIDNSRSRPLPAILGHEGAGVVVETGRGVAGLAAGMTTVAATYGYLGSNGNTQAWGAHAQIKTPFELLPLLKFRQQA